MLIVTTNSYKMEMLLKTDLMKTESFHEAVRNA
jgi:hypothetical protein